MKITAKQTNGFRQAKSGQERRSPFRRRMAARGLALLLAAVVLAGCAVPDAGGLFGQEETVETEGGTYVYGGVREMSAFDLYDVSYIDKIEDFSFAGYLDTEGMTPEQYNAQYVQIFTDPSLKIPVNGEIFFTDYHERTMGLAPTEKPYAEFGYTVRARELRDSGDRQVPNVSSTYSLLGQEEIDLFKGTAYKGAQNYELGSERTYGYEELEDNGWFDHDTYWVVEYYNEKGKKREKPLLTEVHITERGIAKPQNLQTAIDGNGNLRLSWEAVEGASQYAVVLYVPTFSSFGDENDRTALLLDVVEDGRTSWSSKDAPDAYDGIGNSDSFLAVDVTADDLAAQDYYAVSKDEAKIYDAASEYIGVIAMNDRYCSVPATALLIGPNAVVNGLTLPIASQPLNAMEEMGWFKVNDYEIYVLPEEKERMLADFQSFPLMAPYLTADGSLRQGSTQIIVAEEGAAQDVMTYADGTPIWDQQSVNEGILQMGGWDTVQTVKLYAAAKGTESNVLPLESYIVLSDPDYDYRADIEEYNKWSREQSPQADMTLAKMSTAEAQKKFESNELRRTEESVKPETPLNKYTDAISDDPIVQYMMAQFNAGNEAFPVDQYREEGESDELLGARMESLAHLAWAQDGYAYAGTWFGPQYVDGYIVYSSSVEASAQEVGEMAAQALSEIDLSGSDADKVRAINDYVTAHVEYDYDLYEADTASDEELAEGVTDSGVSVGAAITNSGGHSAAGAFTNGLAVCDGYAGMFQALATQAGLESLVVLGNTDRGGHAWNVVKVDGRWKIVDTTWNDSAAEPNQYLLVDMTAFTEKGQSREILTYYWMDEENPLFQEIISDVGAQNMTTDEQKSE